MYECMSVCVCMYVCMCICIYFCVGRASMFGYLVELSDGTAIVLLGRPTGGGAGIITNDTPDEQHHDHLPEQHSTFS